MAWVKPAGSHAACMQHWMGKIQLCPMLFACTIEWGISAMCHAVCIPLSKGKLGLATCHIHATLHWKVYCWAPAQYAYHASLNGYSQLCSTLLAINPEQENPVLTHAVHMHATGCMLSELTRSSVSHMHKPFQPSSRVWSTLHG